MKTLYRIKFIEMEQYCVQRWIIYFFQYLQLWSCCFVQTGPPSMFELSVQLFPSVFFVIAMKRPFHQTRLQKDRNHLRLKDVDLFFYDLKKI